MKTILRFLVLLVPTMAFAYTPPASFPGTYTTNGSQSDVMAAIAAAGADSVAGNGDTVLVPAGSFSWGTGFVAVNINVTGLTLSGTLSGNNIATFIQTVSGGPSGVYGVIQFTAAGGPSSPIYNTVCKNLKIWGLTSGQQAFAADATSNNWRITNVAYDATGSDGSQLDTAYFLFCQGSAGTIDSCTINTGNATSELVFARGPTNAWQTPDTPGSPFTAGVQNCIYIENCTLTGASYLTDINSNARAVVRYCTISGNGAKIDAHGMDTNSPARSFREIEIYRNTWGSGSGAEAIDVRGATGFIFDNKAPYGTSSDIWFWLECQSTRGLYPNYGSQYQTPYDYVIKDQIGSGEDVSESPFAQGSDPMYVFNNLAAATDGAGTATVPWVFQFGSGNGAVAAGAISLYASQQGTYSTFNISNTGGIPGTQVIMPDRDLFTDISVYYTWSTTNPPVVSARGNPVFDGSTGVGRGTKQDMLNLNMTDKTRPVGYWVTDEGSWNQSGDGLGSGQLYVWNGNAWVLKYTPYQYPFYAAAAPTTTINCTTFTTH